MKAAIQKEEDPNRLTELVLASIPFGDALEAGALSILSPTRSLCVREHLAGPERAGGRVRLYRAHSAAGPI